MFAHAPSVLLVTILAMYVPVCTPPVRLVPATPADAPSSLWQPPDDLEERDLQHGFWGSERAPRADDTFTLVRLKHTGVNPGMVVRDRLGRRWNVKQAPADGQAPEGPVEVVLSRVLSAIGYHQPPVYYLPEFTLVDDWGSHREPGGRFRLSDPSLTEVGTWSWQQNPYVGTTPYQGLLVVLLVFNSSDLKNSNNSIYTYRRGDQAARWYVVRDLGSALGETGRVAPRQNDVHRFERERFVLGVQNGVVAFANRGWHQELLRGRIRAADVGWAGALLARLSDRQWTDAFAAGGYPPDLAARYIRKIHANIAEALRVGDEPRLSTERR